MIRPAVRETSWPAVFVLAGLGAAIGLYINLAWGAQLGEYGAYISAALGCVVALLVGFVHTRAAAPRTAIALVLLTPVAGALIGHLRFREQYGEHAGWLGLGAGAVAAVLLVAVSGRMADSRARRSHSQAGGLYG